MFKKTKTKSFLYAGVDIGSDSIKILEAVSDQGQLTLTKFSISPITENPLKEDIKNALEKSELSAKEIYLSLSGPNAIVRFIQMPDMSEEALKNSIGFEADKYIPFSVEDVYLDSCILGIEAIEKGKMGVLFAAAKKEVVDSRLAMFMELGYQVELIDVDVFSIFNAFIASTEEKKRKNSYALINIGHKYTNIIISNGDEPAFCRDIQIGGEYLLKAAMNSLGLSKNEILNDTDGGDKISEIIKVPFLKLLDEIKLSFGYYENQYGKAVENVFMSGGCSDIKGVREMFKEAIGFDAQHWDCTEKFGIGPEVDEKELKKNKNSLAIVCGLLQRTDIL